MSGSEYAVTRQGDSDSTQCEISSLLGFFLSKLWGVDEL